MTIKGSVFPFTNPSGKQVWKVEVTTGYRPNGSPRTVRRTAQSKREAEHLRITLLSELRDGLLKERSSTRVRTFALWWIREVKAREIKPATAADYESRYRAYIDPTFGHRPLDSVTALDITTWLADLNAKNLSDATQNGALQVFKMILKAAHSHQEIRTNPGQGIPRLKFPRTTRVKPPWTREEAQQALQFAKGTELELPLLFALHLGLRIGEILGLKWSDIDFETGLLSITRSIRETRHFQPDGSSRFSLTESTPKTVASVRQVALTYGLQSALLAQRERQQDRDLFRSTGWIHATHSPHPLRPNRLAKMYKLFLHEHGLRPIRFHDLRHSAATLSLSAGVRIEALSQNLGHSSIDITKRIYAPKVAALSREHSEAIEGYLSPQNASLISQQDRSKK
jgi:integrase